MIYCTLRLYHHVQRMEVDEPLARVPVKGDEIEHEDTLYTVTTVVLPTDPDKQPYVVAKVPL